MRLFFFFLSRIKINGIICILTIRKKVNQQMKKLAVMLAIFLMMVSVALCEDKEKEPTQTNRFFFMGSGSVLLSRAVSSQVPSALKGLTSVFGMGTGGTPSSLPPEILNCFVLHPDNCTSNDS